MFAGVWINLWGISKTRICKLNYKSLHFRSSHPEVFLGKGVLKICSKFTGEYLSRSVISRKLLSSFIEITLWHGCSPVNFLYIFRIPFPKNPSWWLLLTFRNARGMVRKWQRLIGFCTISAYGFHNDSLCNIYSYFTLLFERF